MSLYLKELLGNMTDREPFIYLSDGGHFENTGVYELLRRRCRVIIVSDASQDRSRGFRGLAYAVTLARMDLNTEIEFSESRNGTLPAGRVTVGRIIYPDGANGIIVYIKPELCGDEPVDVASYARRHLTFPHDYTANQWFTEQQFEAYRKLGELSGEAAGQMYWVLVQS
jgi:hypothetical protein